MTPVTHAQRVLVLGGTSSGKSSFAERLLTDETVDPSTEFRYLATGRENPDDPDWQARIGAHRARRGADWHTVECGTDPDRLLDALAEAPADSVVLVDDVGGWAGTLLDAAPDGPDPSDTGAATDHPARLADAVRNCPARRLVLVSPEVGLSVVPATRSGRLFTDLLGACNRAVADACDAVALVVAGRVLWLP
ncbi:MAG: bifunctional adenosylcobinamide kinase/adenosylcobinamide-phosphate guanylyltransferase, partial [Actinocatenispora sp.]